MDEKCASWVSRPVLSQEWRMGEELIRRGGTSERNRVLRGLVGRHLHHAEIFLRNEILFHAKAKFIASRSGKDRGTDSHE